MGITSGWPVGFSADGRGVLTTRGFAPLEAREDWPGSAQRAAESQTIDRSQFSMDYYLADGWIWHVDAGARPRRVCWLPPIYRDIDLWNGHDRFGAKHLPRLDMAVGHQAIAFRTKERGLVILNLSRCHFETRKCVYMTSSCLC